MQGSHTEALLNTTNGIGLDVVIDFVSSQSTLEAAVGVLGRGGRLVTLGGSGEPFEAPSSVMLEKELELIGSRYATKQEVTDALELVACGEVNPLVTGTVSFEGIEGLHERLENGQVTGRAALLIDE